LQSLDDFAGLGPPARGSGQLVPALESIESELEELNRSEQEKLRMADLWSFQRKEIDAAALKPGEDAQLEQERAGAAQCRQASGERECGLRGAV
jgi:DNA repair protein RecN (Recombination protein N)